MLKRLLLCFCVFFTGAGYTCGKNLINPTDSIAIIAKIQDVTTREKKLVVFTRAYLYDAPTQNILDRKKKIVDSLLTKSGIDNLKALLFFVESMYHKKEQRFEQGQYDVLRAIPLANKVNDHFLLYTFFNQLGFLEADNGNFIKAIESYKIAKGESLKLNDFELQAHEDNNIADIYLKIHLYNQSLYYLNQSLKIANKYSIPEFKCFVLLNKAVVFYGLNDLDSLARCYQALQTLKNPPPNLQIFTRHTQFYTYVLKHNYPKAISEIRELLKDSLTFDSSLDYQDLATAYYKNHQIDSARQIIKYLQAKLPARGLPDLKSQLYEMAGNMAWDEHSYQFAADDLKMALAQAKDNVKNLSQINNVSLQMEVDDAERSYTQSAEKYKQERWLLIFLVVLTVLITLLVTLLYRNARQRTRYEKLLLTAKKEELAFINSHEVRRHLTNILGLIEVIKLSADRQSDYEAAEEKLFYSAEQLDKSIKSISEKLDEY